ncbi:MAG: phenylphosphate carboxylase subunit delta, partial [Xanthomonadales bacterium]|nr:phenylphosphate carboxylase subunit delta [Xanthomonadales bacterium]
MADIDPLLLERAHGIRLLVLDVDGVLTDGRLYFDSHGSEMKAFHTRDGLGMKAVQEHGIALALITARESSMVRDRAAQLGVEHVYQGREDK